MPNRVLIAWEWTFFWGVALGLLSSREGRADSLTKNGGGNFTLTADSSTTFVGPTRINDGNFILSGAGKLSPTGSITVESPGNFDISLSAGAQTIGDLSGSGTVTLGAVGLTTGGSNNSTTFSGVFSGSGTITKTGGGVFILSGDSSLSYTGSFIIDAGTLSVGSDNSLGNAAGSITINGATLQLTAGAGPFSSSRQIFLTGTSTIDVPSTTWTLSGVISGVTGTLMKTGAGTLALFAANSYAQGTIIDAGTLSLLAVNTLPVSKDVTLNNSAILALDDNDQTIGGLTSGSFTTTVDLGTLAATQLTIGGGNASSTFSGMIQGAGKILKTGSGTLILLGANSYSGGTTVSAGVLQGNATSLQGAIIDNASLVFDQSGVGTYAGAVSGGGTFTKIGSGTLDITNIVSQATATVSVGTLAVNGFLVANTIVNAGAVLQGNAFIFGNVTNFGTVKPGNSVGNIFVFGNYLQASGSTLEIEFNPFTADLLQVTGDVMIQTGTTLSLVPDFGSYAPNTIYTVVSSGGPQGIVGRFTSIVLSLPTFSVQVRYLPPGAKQTELDLLINALPFSDVVIGGNNGAVARCLDTLSTEEESDSALQLDQLRFMNPVQLDHALSQLHPGLFTGLFLSEQETTLKVRSALSRRWYQVNRKCCRDEKRSHFWADYSYSIANQETLSNQQVGFESWTRAIVAGYDFFVGRPFHTGLLLAYSQDRLHWKDARGRNWAESGYGAFYSGWRSSFFYVQGAAMGTLNFYRTLRTITFVGRAFPIQIRRAKSSAKGFGGAAHLEIGGVISRRSFEFKPFARGDYIFLHRGSFSETGAETLDLHVDSSNGSLWEGELGFQISNCFSKNDRFCMIPYLKLGWIWEMRHLGEMQRGNFEGTSCVMAVTGLYPVRHLIAPAVGLELFWDDFISCTLDYEGEWGSHYKDQMGIGRLKISF